MDPNEKSRPFQMLMYLHTRELVYRIPCLRCEGRGYIGLSNQANPCWMCKGSGKIPFELGQRLSPEGERG